MKEPLLVIFRDCPEKGVAWAESGYGLANAQRRMDQIAAEKPGVYFLFDLETASIVARTNTVKEARSVPPPTDAALADRSPSQQRLTADEPDNWTCWSRYQLFR